MIDSGQQTSQTAWLLAAKSTTDRMATSCQQGTFFDFDPFPEEAVSRIATVG